MTMYAPKAKFELIYIVSPAKVAAIFLSILHCLFLIIALLTSFWVGTPRGHYGPIYQCEKTFNSSLAVRKVYYKCGLSNSIWMILITILLLLSLIIILLSIIIGTIAIIRNSFSRRRLWMITILLILIGCLIDIFIIILIPLIYARQDFWFHWAFGVHMGGTLFIFVALIVAFLTHNIDDTQYLETIEEARYNEQNELEPLE